MQETYRLLKENNALYLRSEACWFQGATSSFERLKVYFDSKVQHDVNLNYQEIVDDFFVQYDHILLEGDTILVKASHGMHLEKIINTLTE